MTDELLDARGIVVAGEARPRAGDRPGFDHIAAHRHQAFGRGAYHRPTFTGEYTRERCRVVFAQALEQRRRRQWRIEARAPAARQIDLEDIAGGQVIQYALHAVDV